ncbi:MAG: hypothetical protein K8H88_05700, partial [Sandaracinaceae bacterium]|nr:hypothetical protein [Sandaracinaceae bacterium]
MKIDQVGIAIAEAPVGSELLGVGAFEHSQASSARGGRLAQPLGVLLALEALAIEAPVSVGLSEQIDLRAGPL